METSSTRAERATTGSGPSAEGAPPLAVLLREGFRWFMERLNEDASALGDVRLSAPAAVVVSYLRPSGSRPADVARSMGVTRQHVHAVVRELVDAGVVEVTSDPHSRRDRLIVPTAAGEARRRRAVEHLAALETELGDRVGEGDLAQLRRTLERLWTPRPERPPAPLRGADRYDEGDGVRISTEGR